MATYEMREVQTTTLEIAVPAPAVAADLGKAAHAMRNGLQSRGLRVDTDDCYRVEVGDEHIYLRAEVDTVRGDI